MFPCISSQNYKSFQFFEKLYENWYLKVCVLYIIIHGFLDRELIHRSIEPNLLYCIFSAPVEQSKYPSKLDVTVGSAPRDCMWDQHDRLSLVSLTSVLTVRQAATWIIEDIHMQICVMTMPNNTFCYTLESWRKAWLTLSLTPLTICYHVTD